LSHSPPILIPVHAIKGRGTASQTPHRFARDTRADFDDGWDTVQNDALEGHAPPATQIILEDAKSVIVKNDSPDIYFDYSVNPYRGCEHGCVYCYARPKHSYLGLSPGLDFETKIIAKRNVATVLRAELARPAYVARLLNIGSATDCYQPVERELRLTRQVIEVMREVQHPFSLITKSSAVEHDLDLIAPMAADHLAAVYVTITTLDGKLARVMEPRAAAPHRRLRTIETLARAGVPVGVSVAPQIPFINEDMEQVLQAAADAGARSAFYTVLRLPWELSDVFREWLQLHYPQRAARVMARVQEMRGGKDYASDFATRMKGEGVWAELLRARFETACRKLDLNRVRTELDLTRFVRPVRGPPAGGAASGQASLF
jgi:DNA repair photolyase